MSKRKQKGIVIILGVFPSILLIVKGFVNFFSHRGFDWPDAVVAPFLVGAFIAAAVVVSIALVLFWRKFYWGLTFFLFIAHVEILVPSVVWTLYKTLDFPTADSPYGGTGWPLLLLILFFLPAVHTLIAGAGWPILFALFFLPASVTLMGLLVDGFLYFYSRKSKMVNSNST